jgi:YD repeat-containing protein
MSLPLWLPHRLTVDKSGRIYFTEEDDPFIYSISPGGFASIVAGALYVENAPSGDGGPATSAVLDQPRGLTTDDYGNLYFAELGGNRVRKVSPSGIISTVAGNGSSGYSEDGGLATSASLSGPHDVAVDSAGNVYFDDMYGVRKVSTSGIISTVVGGISATSSGDGIPATTAQIIGISGLAFDSTGALYIVVRSDIESRIRKVTAGTITTVVGTGVPGFSGDGGLATAAQINYPYDVAFDAADNLYLADWGNYRVRRVTPSGIIDTIAGTGNNGYSGDLGPASSADFYLVSGIATDAAGNVYVADTARFRKISSGTQLVGGAITPTETLGGGNLAEYQTQCNCTGYPVNAATGDFWHTFNDVVIPGRGGGLALGRTYDSLSAQTDSAFGYGWSFSYGMSITYSSATGTAIVRQENGALVAFKDNGSGTFRAPPRVAATLTHNSDGTWTFTRHKTATFTFDSAGKITGAKDLNGYATTIARPTSNTLTVTDQANRTLTLTLTGSRVTGLTDPAGRTMSFGYDTSGNLIDVVDVSGGHTQFTYDTAHRMLTMREPRFYGDTTTVPSPVITSHYDTGGLVDWQTDQLGRKTSFDRTSIPGSVKVTDPKATSLCRPTPTGFSRHAPQDLEVPRRRPGRTPTTSGPLVSVPSPTRMVTSPPRATTPMAIRPWSTTR